MAYESFRAIVPAGGAGRRLWPVSRQVNPKFLHDFTGSGSSLLQVTVGRLNTMADEVVVVSGPTYAQVVQEHVPACAVLAEPLPRDSMPAIALATAVLMIRYPREDLVVGSFAADHHITNREAFEHAVGAAVELARRDEVVTLGIAPTHPATAYGYIHPGEEHHTEAGVVAHRVEGFEEKPDAQTAATYVSQGYVWNAGMYVARSHVLFDHLRRLHPDLAEGVWEVAQAWDSPRRREVAERIWPTLPSVSIDHALAEPLAPENQVMVVPADLGWSDIGDWDAIGSILSGQDPRAPVVLGQSSRLTTVDAPGAVVAPSKQVVVVGIEGAVVIETDDAILVTTRQQAQQVKAATEKLAEQGLDHLL